MLQAHKEKLVLKEQLEPKVKLELRELQVLKVYKEFKVYKVYKV